MLFAGCLCSSQRHIRRMAWARTRQYSPCRRRRDSQTILFALHLGLLSFSRENWACWRLTHFCKEMQQKDPLLFQKTHAPATVIPSNLKHAYWWRKLTTWSMHSTSASSGYFSLRSPQMVPNMASSSTVRVQEGENEQNIPLQGKFNREILKGVRNSARHSLKTPVRDFSWEGQHRVFPAS